jgi:hypothetical protein
MFLSFSATEAAKPLAFSQGLKRGANRLQSRTIHVLRGFTLGGVHRAIGCSFYEVGRREVCEVFVLLGLRQQLPVLKGIVCSLLSAQQRKRAILRSGFHGHLPNKGIHFYSLQLFRASDFYGRVADIGTRLDTRSKASPNCYTHPIYWTYPSAGL